MDQKYLKTRQTLDRENRELRNILRRIIDMDPANVDASTLSAIQNDAAATLDSMDGRKLGAGFTRPEVQSKIAAPGRARQMAFLAEVGPVLKELYDSGMSFSMMADALNQRGIAAPAGGDWSKGSVKFQWDALAKIGAQGA